MISVGDKIGDWEIINTTDPYVSPKGYAQSRWLCKCICGKEKQVRESSLLGGDSTGCGCRRDRNYFEINGISYKTREVFKNPHNVFTLAKNQNLSFHQFIANVFDKILTVRVKIAKESVAVKPTVNMSQF